ncbi:MAG TPA: phosphatase PAP2 family protein [Kofleriaceae bacterium]|nr:phosphatase PAP2 family protein [Kofleriaceae bacterium]
MKLLVQALILVVLGVHVGTAAAQESPPVPSGPPPVDDAVTVPPSDPPVAPEPAPAQLDVPPPVALAPTKEWYQGNAGRRRLAHLGVVALAGVGYVASETVLKPVWASKDCGWCTPPGIDVTMRDNFKWKDTQLAARLADLDGYVMAPIFGLGAIWLTSINDHGNDSRMARWIDDGIPIVEALTFAQLAVQAIKFTTARQRPFVHYADPSRAHETDDNMSFISGHSALPFSVATSAGIVAHRRGYKMEPLIWGVGMTLASTTAYLRIAADKHYFTDVVGGSAMGALFGAAVPLLLHNGVLQRHQINIAPTGNGMVVSGAF